MRAELDELVAFHLAGERAAAGDAAGLRPVAAGTAYRPALLARYRDLAALRYDFPVVLVAGAGTTAEAVVALSALVDDLLSGIAAGSADATDQARLRHHALRLERELRRLLAEGAERQHRAGAAGLLSELWRRAESRLLEASDGDALLVDSLGRLRRALALDGELVDCDRELPARLIAHLWRTAERRKAQASRLRLARLAVALGDLLHADEAGSAEGLAPERLRTSIGGAFADEFDFAAASRLLVGSRPEVRLAPSRRRRIERLLTELVAAATRLDEGALERAVASSFVAALAAWKRDRAARSTLALAILASELEIEGRYREEKHDALFAALERQERELGGELEAAGRGLSPDPLVVASADGLAPAECAALDELLLAGAPVKALLRTDDLAGAPGAAGCGGAAARVRTATATALGDVFVLQGASSQLFRLRGALARGCDHDGPALFSVYSGAGGETGDLPAYLVAAAAVESRAFPSFVHDPSAGEDPASRFSLPGNPEPEADWPARRLEYEDEEMKRVAVETRFTLADFLAADARWADALAELAPASGGERSSTVAEALDETPAALPGRVPTLWVTDRHGALRRVVVARRLVELSRRAREQWRSLQERAGLRGALLERRLAEARRAWEEERAAAGPPPVEAPAPAPVVAVAIAAPSGEAPPAHGRDDAWVETARCSTCNECIRINDRMFVYDANRQATLADPAAGSYAQLVEAAESCQVAIIHPGKPRNPAEPGLEGLLARAEPFR